LAAEVGSYFMKSLTAIISSEAEPFQESVEIGTIIILLFALHEKVPSALQVPHVPSA
jgi:hypothetical protein